MKVGVKSSNFLSGVLEEKTKLILNRWFIKKPLIPSLEINVFAGWLDSVILLGTYCCISFDFLSTIDPT